MSDCQHESFNANVDIHRLMADEDGPMESLAIDVRASCAQCGKPVRFEGPIGLSIGRGAHPCVSFDGLELRAAGHMGNNDTPHLGFRLTGGS